MIDFSFFREMLTKFFSHQQRRIDESLQRELQPLKNELRHLRDAMERVAADLDGIDRHNRPWGDGWKPEPKRRPRW